MLNTEIYALIILSNQNKQILGRVITLSSTKERIDGLGRMARNCAFFDSSTDFAFAESSCFSLLLSESNANEFRGKGLIYFTRR